MSQAGTKPAVEHRLSLFDKCEALDLEVDGTNPCKMKFAALKKAAARNGLLHLTFLAQHKTK